jgi:putative ABC transport system substrate-binding protein
MAPPNRAQRNEDLRDLPSERCRRADRDPLAADGRRGHRVELALVEAQSPEEALAVIATLPKGAALFFVPTPSLEPIGRLVEAAAQRGIAAAANVDRAREAGVLVTYAVDWFAVGQQAARLVDQILKGAKPADLPVETAEHFLHINLKAATAIGLTIPDDILRQADLVIR